jgi:hypothetical protein
MNGTASGYKEERVAEKLTTQLEDILKTWNGLKPLVAKFKNDP